MLLSLQQAILIRPERPWMEAFAALPGGALLVLVGGIVEKQVHKVHANKVHIVHDFKASQNDRYDFKDTKCQFRY